MKIERTVVKRELAWDSPGMGVFSAVITDGKLVAVDMRIEHGDSQNNRLIVREHSDDTTEFLRRVRKCIDELLAELDALAAEPTGLVYNEYFRYIGAGKDGETVRGRVVNGILELLDYPGAKFNPIHFKKVTHAAVDEATGAL